MLNTKIKASAVTNLTDARYFAAWGVKWMGFDLNLGSPDYLPAEKIIAIKEWIDGVEIIGEWSMATQEAFDDVLRPLQLDGVQVGSFTDTKLVEGLPRALTKIREHVLEGHSDLLKLEDQMKTHKVIFDYFLLDFEKNKLKWSAFSSDGKSKLQDLCRAFPIIISIECNEVSTREIITEIKPAGLNLKGGIEEKVGYKSFDELDKILETLEQLS